MTISGMSVEPSYEELEQRVRELERAQRIADSVHRVNRAIIREKDRDRLIQQICSHLAGTRGYAYAWIALDHEAPSMASFAQSGLDHNRLILRDMIEQGSLPCTHVGSGSSKVKVIDDPAVSCNGCPLGHELSGRAVISVRLEHGGTRYGLMTASVVQDASAVEEESVLLQEVAKDLAIALKNLELEEECHKARKALESSEDFLRVLLEAIPIPVFYKDRQGRYLGFNRAFEAFFGLTRDQLVGKTVYDISPEILADTYYSMDNELFLQGGEQEYESQVMRADQTLRDVVFNKAVFNDVRGKVSGLIGTILDVTARKRAEEALRESEENYRSIFENTGAATIIVEDDTTISLANREFEILSGFSKGQIEGQMSWMDFVAAEEELQVMKHYHEQRRVDPKEIPQRYEFGFRDRQGRFKDISLTIDLIPGTRRSVASLLDISELKRTQVALLEREKKYRLLAENTADIIWSVDADLKLTYISPSVERILGYSQDEALAVSFESMFTPSTHAMLMDTYRKARAGQIRSTLTLELDQVRKDGSLVSTEVGVTPLFDSDGRFAGAQGISRDITSRKKAERLRARQQKRLRQLAVKLASAQDQEQRRIAEGLHDDVAQLLTAGSVKLNVARGCSDPQAAQDLLEEVDLLLRESNEKVRLLSFELGSSTLYRLGLREAIQELCDGMAQRYKVDFSVTGDVAMEDLDQASATALFKSVRELLFNVVKHTCVREAQVFLSREGDMLKLAVEDQGIGFPEHWGGAELDTDKGLGLFGIQERLRDLGGTMRIDSTPNVCTRVTLWAPLGRT